MLDTKRHSIWRMMMVAALAGACVVGAADAQEWPKQRPISLVVFTGPGSVIDTLGRLVASKAGESLGQTIVVDNRPGAGGNIAAQRVRRAPADGYTLLLAAANYAISPSLYANAGYDPIADFVPVFLIGTTPSLIAVHASVPVESLQALIDLSRKRPMAYASPEIGSAAHLAMEQIKASAKSEMTNVPSTPAQAVTATLAEQTQVVIVAAPLLLPHVKSGKLRPLAVTGVKRWPPLREVATAAEQGMAEIDHVTWFGVFAPAGTPADVVTRLNEALNRAVGSTDVADKVTQAGVDFGRNTPAEFGAFVRDEVPKWSRAVKQAGAKVD